MLIYFQDISSEVQSVVDVSVEEKRNSEKEISSQLSHLNISSQTSELDKIEDQRMRSPDVPEQFSDINLRYKYIGLCACKEEAYKVIFADYVKLNKVLRHIIYSIVLKILSWFGEDWERFEVLLTVDCENY